ncbi:hypothetical protein BKA67DRAFT_528584 [Truncatella angustata]|uniref:SMP-30/Gluconolactonase/LRE-like region domain-containing protein n=1 Tax=Truncatella angustata TaxID=152316 RepID=A0A9P8RJS2_9PEZI|nr:uncharacterized protein BKA67DRAFT_528584 [Truncatella angustata]KAH6639975.1 hypothetical protein BKA67DRAFT_528584 [Truncatella angustata]KAH8200652.1 hypothetical protein TruAng_005189 [Truncatella angustata]
MKSSLALGALATATSTAAATARQIWNFTDIITIENSALRSNGQLLLTTFTNASLYSLDTLARSPKADLVAQLPGATAIGGIAAIGADKYAIVGGIRGNYSYTNETIYTVDFSGNLSTPTVKIVATVPGATMLNGLASLPSFPHIVLATDSRQGNLWRIDTDVGTAEIAFADDLFAVPAGAVTPLGVNGIKIAGGYVYFTNTGQYIFGRVPITEDGSKAGDAEVIANATNGYDWDDFAIDTAGNFYTAQTPNAAGQVSLDGTYGTLAGGENSTLFHRPTSVTVSENTKKLYVTTGGNTINGIMYSGQVIEVQLKKNTSLST